MEVQSKHFTGITLPLVLEEGRQPAGDPGTQAANQHAQRDGAKSQGDLRTRPITHGGAPRGVVGQAGLGAKSARSSRSASRSLSVPASGRAAGQGVQPSVPLEALALASESQRALQGSTQH